MSDTSLNRYLGQGDDAAEAAYTPVPVTGTTPEQAVLYVNEEDPTQPELKWWDGANFVPFVVAGAGTVTNTGALTLNTLVVGNGTTDIKIATTGTGILTALGTNVGSAGAPVVQNGALGTPTSGTLTSAIVGSATAYLNYQDQKAQNTDGGTFTSGAWRTRVLTTEVSDVGGYGTLASNQMTLAAGTYLVSAFAPAFGVDRHQLRLQNVTDTATLVTGQVAFSANSAGSPFNQDVAVLRGIFTVGASKALELQHQGQTTETTNGFGIACNFTTEVYAVVELWKLA